MQIIIARIMWLILPLFGRALTNQLLSANVSLVSSFLANASITSLGYLLITATQANGMGNTVLGQNLMTFLNARNIRGPFAQVFGYWMVVAAFVGKILYVSLFIVISPLIGVFTYWIFKSMGWSVMWLTEIYNLLPSSIKSYFIYINKEMMSTLHFFFNPVIDTGKEYGKILLYWKSFVNICIVIGNSTYFNTFFTTYIDPAFLYLANMPYVGAVMVFGTKTFYAVLGIAMSILPTWSTDLVGWILSPNIFRAEWLGITWGWIKTLFGW